MKTIHRYTSVVLSATLAVATIPVHGELILDWNAQAVSAIQASGEDTAQASRDMALLSTAIYDAVNGIDGGYSAYYVQGSGPSGASMEAAAASAAKTVLEALYPTMGSSFATLYNDQLSTIADSQSRTDGVNWGGQVAAAILNSRPSNEVSNSANTPYSTAGQIGRWATTPTHNPANGYQFPPTQPGWGNVVPFGIPQGSQFRPAGTLDLTSTAYAASYNQVQALGSATSATRTAAQTAAAFAWAAGAGSATAAGQWNQVAAQIINGAGLDLRTQARILATLNIAVADATISAFDASYANDNWRPVTAIAYGDSDGNPDTAGTDIFSPDWDPLVDTPPMPSFVNANTAIAGAAARVLKYYFGNHTLQVMVDTDGDGVADTLMTYTVDGALTDASMAPIWGGTDFSYATDAGVLAGDQSAAYDLTNYFLPVAQVPEPSSFLLALGGLMMLRRRRTSVCGKVINPYPTVPRS